MADNVLVRMETILIACKQRNETVFLFTLGEKEWREWQQLATTELVDPNQDVIGGGKFHGVPVKKDNYLPAGLFYSIRNDA